jgi:hypothetical protein
MRQEAQVLHACFGNHHLADESQLAAYGHRGQLVAAKRALDRL